MTEQDPTEKIHLVALRAALVVDAVREALDALTGLAQSYAARGMEQEAANLLTFVLHHPDVRYDTFDRAEELHMDLEARACPRIFEDAQQFVLGKSLKTIAAWVFALAGDEGDSHA